MMPNGGRRPGSQNQKTLELREKMEALLGNISVPEKLVMIANNLERQGDMKAAADVFDKAARFVYPTLKAIEHSGEIHAEMPLAPEPGPAPL